MVSPLVVRTKREIAITYVGIVITLVASVLVYLELGPIILGHMNGASWNTVATHLLGLGIITFLIYGGLVYQFTRVSYLERRERHRRASRNELESVYDTSHCRALTILVPAYKEDAQVVFLTLMSAALQEYPNRRVVLLIDVHLYQETNRMQTRSELCAPFHDT